MNINIKIGEIMLYKNKLNALLDICNLEDPTNFFAKAVFKNLKSIEALWVDNVANKVEVTEKSPEYQKYLVHVRGEYLKFLKANVKLSKQDFDKGWKTRSEELDKEHPEIIIKREENRIKLEGMTDVEVRFDYTPCSRSKAPQMTARQMECADFFLSDLDF